jgi:DNA-binding transcriptional LysR family regulator
MNTVSKSFTIDLRRLHVLRMLDEHRTITATATVLHRTPSAVSQQLTVLAREVGVPLLARNGRTVSLTGQARLLLDHADTLLAQLEHARADLAAYSRGACGNVSMGAFASAITGLLVPAIAVLGRDRPQLTVTVTEVHAPACFRDLDTGRLDLAITVDYPGGPPRADPRYHRLDLHRDPYDVALSASHPLARQPALTLTDLASHPWIAAAGNGPCAEISLAAAAAVGFTPRVTHRIDDYAAALALVAVGAGVSLIPRLAGVCAPQGVVIRSLGDSAPARTIYAAVQAGAQHDPRLAAVLAAVAIRRLDRPGSARALP